MKVLVTGSNGQLGYDVAKALERGNVECLGVDVDDFDLTDEGRVKDFIMSYGPDAVVHCAAYTAVDRAEDERETCRKVNVDGTRYVAEACKESDAKMIYISTDYVFPGSGEEHYETWDETGPKGYYGLTKLQGEECVRACLSRYFIVRISWVFGRNGNNFVKTMLRLGGERDEISVVDDQVGSPTYTVDLAELLCDMLKTDQYGIYHATNESLCSWAEFAAEIFQVAGLSTRVRGIASEEYPTKAARPKNSRMSKRSLEEAGFDRLPHWKDALRRYYGDAHAGR